MINMNNVHMIESNNLTNKKYLTLSRPQRKLN